jgi:DNA-binding PadR family transcriptional regulator
MKHEHRRDHDGPDHHHGHRKQHGRHRRHGARPFDYGELRLLILAMIAEQPRHGYELIRGIEERMGGSYTPSPGVIYPTLAWLEDSGFARVEEAAGRKSYSLTKDGKTFLAANQAAVDEILTRTSTRGEGGRYEGVPAPVVRGMENLKLALRLRLRRGDLDAASAETIASALDAAAKKIEGA